MALTVVNDLVDGKWYSALIESGFSRSIVSAERCRSWTGMHVVVETIGGKMQACCTVGTVNICTDIGNSAEVEVLMVRDKPLVFDLLAGIDATIALDVINITQTEAVRLSSKETPTWATIHIDLADFSVEFNHHQRVWTAK